LIYLTKELAFDVNKHKNKRQSTLNEQFLSSTALQFIKNQC